MSLPLFVPGGPGALELVFVLVSFLIQLAIVAGIVVLAVRLFDVDLGGGGGSADDDLRARVTELERQVQELQCDDE